MYAPVNIVTLAAVVVTGLIVLAALNGLVLRFAVLPMLVVYAQIRQSGRGADSYGNMEQRLLRAEREIRRLRAQYISENR